MIAQNDISILFADDQPFMRETVRNILRSKGYKQIETVSDGREALRSLRNKIPGFVIADWNMPHITGIELLKIMRNDIQFFRIPFLMLTGEGSHEMIMYALEEDSDGFIVKPFTPIGLINKVTGILHQTSHPDELHSMLIRMKFLKLTQKYEQALEIGYEILRTRQSPKATLLTIECLYNTKKYDAAARMMQDSHDEDKSSKHLSLYAKVLFALEKQTSAIEFMERASIKNPLNQTIKIDLARAYFNAGRNDDAENIIMDIEKNETGDLIMADIAQMYIDRNNLDRASFFIEKAGSPIKETVHIFNNYAVELRKAGKYSESLEIYKKCVKIESRSDILYYNLGLLYSMMGKSEEAKKAIAKSLELNPENKIAESMSMKLGARSS